MKQFFWAVFESVWKRKETKIFLLFSFYPLIFMTATMFPNSEFMQIHVTSGYRMGAVELFNLLLGSINSLTLPILALYYLTHTVFKKEIDDSLMFLYKDINRKKVFGAKLLSLFIIVLLFLVLSFICTVFSHYTRVVHLPYGSMAIFPSTFKETMQVLIAILTNVFDFFLSVTIAMVLSLYFGSGTTMTMGIIVSIITSLLPILGGVSATLYPTGYTSFAYQGHIIFAIFGLIITFSMYMLLSVRLGVKKFTKMEF